MIIKINPVSIVMISPGLLTLPGSLSYKDSISYLLKMPAPIKHRLIPIIIICIYIFGFYFFYLKYVPLIPGLQMVLLPIFFIVFGMTIIDFDTGTLGFIFFIPLINSLPYFFGIYENTPHAPLTLVLFLFYFLGFLFRTALFKFHFDFNREVFKPMFFFLILVLVSGFITFFRYANFYPFLSDSIYELTTNTYGVSAGGAIMSVVFSSLNYITGLVFFFLMLNTLNSSRLINNVFVVLSISSVISLGFGLFQKISYQNIGKNLLNIKLDLVNGTFKDSISLGTFLAMIIPVFLGLILTFKGKKRILSLICLSMAVYLIFHTGSKIALISVMFSFIIFCVFSFLFYHRSKKGRLFLQRRIIFSALILVILTLSSFSFLMITGKLTKSQSITRLQDMFALGAFDSISHSRGVQWRSAVSMVKDYPATGTGVGAYIIELPNYAQKYSNLQKPPESAENYFLQVVSELGILGLIPIFWILGYIGLNILKRLLSLPPPNNYVFLLSGLMIGITAYFFHLIFHSYIGSFEVKYLFWLLAATALSMGQKQTGRKRPFFFKKSFWLTGIIIICVFAGIHLWNSTRSLSLEHRTKEFNLVHDFGFYPLEKTPGGEVFNWSKKTAGRSVFIDSPVLHIPLKASHPDIGFHPVYLKLYLVKDLFREKILLDEVTIQDSGWKILEYPVKDYLHSDIILLIEVDRVWNPSKILGSPDNRNIGIALGKISLGSIS